MLFRRPWVTSGPADGGQVYLTFDDGPDPRWTPRILDILAAARVRATFFVIGRLALMQGALLRRVQSEGHDVGNHGWSHRHPWTLRPVAARQEVRAGAAAIADALGCQPLLFRPAHGRLHPSMFREAADSGQSVVLWSRTALDWGPLGHGAAIARRLGKIKAGDIVLMHDGAGAINRPEELTSILPQQLETLASKRFCPSLL